MNTGNHSNQIAKIKIKPLRYTLMELREMNYLKRKGKPIPSELLNKPFEDFDVNNNINQIRQKKIDNSKIHKINEDNKESSELSNTKKSQIYNNLNENDKDKKSKNSSKNDNDNVILKLQFCDGNDDNNSSSFNSNENNDE